MAQGNPRRRTLAQCRWRQSLRIAALPRAECSLFQRGAGFGRVEAARALAKLPVRVTIIDRKNHHTFQPLLYQVATAGISPAEIAAPIRWILRGRSNVEVLLGEVVDFDLQRRIVKLTD